MNANEPREQGTGGWSQFGATPPAAGGFPRRETIVMEQPPPPPPAPARPRLSAGQKAVAGLALAAMAIGGGVVGAAVTTAFQPDRQQLVSAPSPALRPAS
ncbi:MAG: trypsin, partial [Nonomuraea sp.]|nr:trypsin [Nonomuraea sp.]